MKKWNNPGSQSVIVWDTCGYWFYLPAFFYDDPATLHNYDYIIDTYHPANKDQAFVNPETGKYLMNYSCGQAIMYLPAFVAGHIWSRVSGYPSDGFSRPYQLSLVFWTVMISCIGLWFLRRLLLRYFDDWLVAVILLILCLGTNYYAYASFSSLSHTYLFTLYTLILLLTDSFYRDERHRPWRVIMIGLICGLATITRPTEIICILIPLLWGVRGIEDMKARIAFLLHKISVPVLFAASAIVVAIPQLIYWKVYAGHWLFFSYHGDDKTFSFLYPHILDVLISYKKGWLMYTPVMLLAIIGFYHLYKNFRPIFWAICSFSVINLYLISSWDCWWYGGSFSMRPIIQSYPLLVFPMAAFLNDTLRRAYLKYIVVLFMGFCIWLNLFMTYQVNASSRYGIIDGDSTTGAYYWRIFGKTEVTLKDKKLLDTDEEMPLRLEPDLREIYTLQLTGVHADSIILFDGKECMMLDNARQRTKNLVVPVANTVHHGWYRVYATVYFPEKESNMWWQTQMKVAFQNDENHRDVKKKMIRIQRITEQGGWQQVYVDIKATRKQYDKMYIAFWNADGQKSIYLTDIKVSYTAGQ